MRVMNSIRDRTYGKKIEYISDVNIQFSNKVRQRKRGRKWGGYTREARHQKRAASVL